MSLKIFYALSSCILSLVLVSPSSCSASDQTTSTRPNILWISFEDFSPNLPFFGDPRAHMPNLSKLVSEGCLFTRAYSTSPVCAPSRSTIITGVYAATLGTQNMRTSVPLPPDIKPFPAYLRQAGYYCTNNVKTDYNFPIPEGTWDESSKKAHWRNRPDPTQPFFSVFNFTVTHESRFKMRPGKFEAEVKDVKPEHRIDPAKVQLPPYFPDTPVTRKNWARQYDMASELDIQAGRILKQLEEDGLTSNTMIFLFSDHGVGLPRSKRWLYDAGLHVPLAIKWPGLLPSGSKNDELVSLMDLAPTVLSNLGLKVPSYMQGRVLLGPGKQPAPEYLFATRDRVDEAVENVRAVRDRQYKYIRNFLPETPYAQPSAYADGNPIMQELRRLAREGTLTGTAALFMQPRKPTEELYDTNADPFEVNNLATEPKYADRVKQMREVLTKWQADINDKGRNPEPPEEAKRAAEERHRRQGDE